MNDDGDFDAWKLCWRVNNHFYKSVANPQKCILCSEVNQYPKDTRRSCFWIDGTRCSAGHGQRSTVQAVEIPDPGLCALCEQNFVFDIVKGKHICRREGCRRIVRVREPEIRKRLAGDKELFKEFLALVQKCNVYECAIHYEEVPYKSMASTSFNGPTPDCDHDRNVCDDCLKAAFENAIRGGRLESLVCPDRECKKKIPTQCIRLNVESDTFKIYNKELALKTISQDEKFRWCTCGRGQIHGGGESNPEWTCLRCKKRHCYICRDESVDICKHLQAVDTQKLRRKIQQRQSALHAFSEAAEKAEHEKEAKRRARENQAATNKEIARISKLCPKAGCGNKIMRNEGCGHFSCRKCKTAFCWGCKVIWWNKKVLHLSGCRIGTSTTTLKANLDLTGYAAAWDRDDGYDLKLDEGIWLIQGHR